MPCMIGNKTYSALCDLGSSVSVPRHSVSKRLFLGKLNPMAITLQLADITYRRLVGILEDVPIEVGKFAYPVEFVVLDMEHKSEAVILRIPFLATTSALIDVQGAKLTLRFGEEEVMFNMKHVTHVPQENKQCSRIDTIANRVSELYEDTRIEQELLTKKPIEKKNVTLQCIELLMTLEKQKQANTFRMLKLN